MIPGSVHPAHGQTKDKLQDGRTPRGVGPILFHTLAPGSSEVPGSSSQKRKNVSGASPKSTWIYTAPCSLAMPCCFGTR